MRAVLKNYRQSPRKVRLVADAIRGLSVPEALARLRYMDKRATASITKVLKSAVANAADTEGVDEKDLFIKTIMIDEGVTLRRFRPRARGRAGRINKRTSHIKLELAKREQGSAKQEAQSTKEKETVKK